MRKVSIGAAVVIAAAILGGQAEAKGCIKGAIVGGVAGHYAGHHGVLGAAAGCAVGRHQANKNARMQQQPSNGQPAQQ